MTGIELIREKRFKMLAEHGVSAESNSESINDRQLAIGASYLMTINMHTLSDKTQRGVKPKNWDMDLWLSMCNKPYKERLIIAGALTAIEIDRLQYVVEEEKNMEDKSIRDHADDFYRTMFGVDQVLTSLTEFAAEFYKYMLSLEETTTSIEKEDEPVEEKIKAKKYEVIGTYPFMSRDYLSVGDVITLDQFDEDHNQFYHLKLTKKVYDAHYEGFPNLFKRVQ